MTKTHLSQASSGTSQAHLAEVRESLRRLIGDASRALRNREGLSDKAIHKARKDLKHARASLRLMRKALPRSAYRCENLALRDAARPLSAVRDAKVNTQTLDKLFADDANAGHRTVIGSLRGKLEKKRLNVRAELMRQPVLDETAALLEASWQRVDAWRATGKASDLRAGLERMYRKARKALAAVEAECSAENLHEWRKQVKYLGLGLEQLRADRADGVSRFAKRAAALVDDLGDDHDLVVLQAHIAAVPSGSHNAHRALGACIVERRLELQKRALRNGRKLLERKPRAFLKRIRKSIDTFPCPLSGTRPRVESPQQAGRPHDRTRGASVRFDVSSESHSIPKSKTL